MVWIGAVGAYLVMGLWFAMLAGQWRQLLLWPRYMGYILPRRW